MNKWPPHGLHRIAGAAYKIILVSCVLWCLGLAWFGMGSVVGFVATAAGLGILMAILAARLRGRAGRWAAILAVPGCALLLSVALLRPSNERTWAFDAAHLPWADIQGDTVTLHNYRNFEWTAADRAVERWETKTVQLSRLRAVDFGMVYWGSPHICHTLLTFDFGADGFVCASIEARREQGEAYSPLAGIFRKYEVCYVLGDERDILRLRTNVRGEDVYLIRLTATPEAARSLFLDYSKSMGSLRTDPQWYHSFATNCTTLLRRHELRLQPGSPWSWRLIANGHLDGYLYDRGYVAHTLPLAELKRRSAVSAAALLAPAEEFSQAIRAGRPGF